MTSLTTPNNRVVFKLDGDLESQGFKIFVEIGVAGQLPRVEVMGYLPANPQLAQQLQQHWQQTYRNIGAPYIRSLDPPQLDLSHPEAMGERLIYRIKPKCSIASHREGRLVACQTSARQLGVAFCQWLQSPEFHRLDLCLREELSKEEDIELLIRSDNRDVPKLPWHLWSFCQSYYRTEVSFGSLVAAQPQLNFPQAKDKIKILAILGHGEGLNTHCDRQFLEHLPQANVEFLVEPKRQDINHKLWQESWDIIFFAGHSQTIEDTGKIYINPQESLEISDLSYGFKEAVKRGLTLAVFNSCDGLGLVQKIEDWQIPIAVVMRELVPDTVAQEFLKSFLAQFSQGHSFRESVRRGREQLQGLEHDFPCASWLPIIYQNRLDLRLTWQSFLTSAQPNNQLELSGSTLGRSWVANFTANLTIPQLLNLGGVVVKNNRLKLSLLLATLVLGQFWGRPSLANYFNTKGQLEITNPSDVERPWVEAKRFFELALVVDGNHSAAHANLGNMYNDIGDLEKAKYHYNRSYELLNAVGCNNLSRLYITQENYRRAATTLMQCQRLLKPDQHWTEYSILKNRGWAAIEQDSYRLAQTYLQAAIALKPNEGAAHCLMAKLPDLERSLFEVHAWTCIDTIRENLPEEIDWKQEVQSMLDTRTLER